MIFDKLYIALFGLLIVTIGCKSNTSELNVDKDANENLATVLFSQLSKDQNTGILLLDSLPFSGKGVGYFENSLMAESIHYVDGFKHGLHKKWFPSGILSFERDYVRGKKENISKSWWSNGNLRSKSIFVDGAGHGLQEEWYMSGSKFKEISLVSGKEEGIQKSWRENGKIYNNYEAKNGRIFGLRRSKLCFVLDKEEVQYRGE